MAVRIQVRRGTAAQWAALNPVLAAGEPAYETDTGNEKIGDGTKPWATLPEKPGRRWAATPTASASSDTGEILSILNAAATAGGDQINLRRASASQPYLWNAPVVVPSLCTIVGAGKYATVAKLTTAEARMKFEDGSAGVSGGFTIHGGTDADRLATVGVEVRIVNQRQFRDIHIQYTTADAFLLNGSQNCDLNSIVAYYNDGNGIAFDNGATGNNLLNCGSSSNLGYAIEWRHRNDISGIVQPGPNYNNVHGGIYEQPWKGATPAAGLIHATAGFNNHLIDIVMSSGSAPGAVTAIKVDGECSLDVTKPGFSGVPATSTFASVANLGFLRFHGYLAPTNALVGITTASGTRLHIDDAYEPLNVTTPLSVAGFVRCSTYPIPFAAAYLASVFIDEADGILKFRDSSAVTHPLY